MFRTIGFLLDISNYVWNWRGSKPVLNHSFHLFYFLNLLSMLLVNGSWFDSAIKQEECGNFRFQRETFGINQGILWEGWKAASCCQRWKIYILLYLFFFASNKSVCFVVFACWYVRCNIIIIWIYRYSLLLRELKYIFLVQLNKIIFYMGNEMDVYTEV